MKYLLIYGFKEIIPKIRLQFNRKLYGFSDSSNFGDYNYFRKGILELNSYKRLAKGVVLMNKQPRGLIKFLKSYGAQYQILKVIA